MNKLLDSVWMADMNLKTTRQLITVAVIFTSSLSGAQIYRTTDAHGNVKFTDRPQPRTEAEKINTGPTNTVRPTEIATKEEPKLEVVDEEAAYYKKMEIISPTNDTIFPNRLVPTPVVVEIAPELKPKHSLRLLLNGIEVSSGRSARQDIPTLNIGSQSVQAEILEGDKILVKSAPITVHGFQPGGSNRGSSSR